MSMKELQQPMWINSLARSSKMEEITPVIFIRRARDALTRSVPPAVRIFGLWIAITRVTTGAFEDPNACHDPSQGCRPILLLGVRVLSFLPTVVIYCMIGSTFVREPWLRYGVLGAAAAFSGPLLLMLVVGLFLGDLDLPLIVKLRAKEAPSLTHIGFGLGYLIGGYGKKRELSGGEEMQNPGLQEAKPILEASAKIGEKGGQISQDSSKEPILSQHAVKQLVAMSSVLAMLWIAAIVCLDFAEESHEMFSGPSDYWRDIFLQWHTRVHVVVTLWFYAAAAWFYLRDRGAVMRELLCGAAMCVVSLASLRITAVHSTMESWAIDGAHAFLGFNIGLAVAFFRRGPLKQSNDKVGSFA